MSTPKRFYWMKLKESFMTSDTVDYFMGQPDGANYVVIYQLLCLKTINTGGRLSRQIGEVIIPYDIPKIQRDLKWFSTDTIRVALELYKAVGLIYVDVDGVLCLANHEDLVGSETDSAARMRSSRQSRSALPPGSPEGATNFAQCAQNVTPDIEIDIENRDRDKRVDTDSKRVRKKKDSKFPDDSKPIRCSTFLAERIQMRLPSEKPFPPERLQQWADAFDKCHRIDGHPWDEIGSVLKFSQEDPFWQQNILSGKTFREKYLQLLAKMNASGSGRKSRAQENMEASYNMMAQWAAEGDDVSDQG